MTQEKLRSIIMEYQEQALIEQKHIQSLMYLLAWMGKKPQIGYSAIFISPILSPINGILLFISSKVISCPTNLLS